jgi:hypothetical protein
VAFSIDYFYVIRRRATPPSVPDRGVPICTPQKILDCAEIGTDATIPHRRKRFYEGPMKRHPRRWVR